MEAHPRSRLRLLIVDDDPILLRSLLDVLESDGHLVTAVADGAAGVAAFEAGHRQGKRLDAVITDLGMPGLDCRRVASAIKQRSSSTPVILLTGWGERLRAEEETPPHVDCILSKPPKLRELCEALAHWCGADKWDRLSDDAEANVDCFRKELGALQVADLGHRRGTELGRTRHTPAHLHPFEFAVSPSFNAGPKLFGKLRAQRCRARA